MTRFLRNTLQALVGGVRGFTIEVVALVVLFTVATVIAFVFTRIL